MSKDNEEWQRLSFQEIKTGMLIKTSKGNHGVVVDKTEGALYVRFEGGSVADVMFSYETEDCLFFTIKKKDVKTAVTKVLSKKEIYEMLLSDTSLHSVSLKAVRKIEKAILEKLGRED